MKPVFSLLLATVLLSACAIKKSAYSSTSVPPPPNYSKIETWAAHPDRQDPADRTPEAQFEDKQANSLVDVFFLHPTTFTEKSSAWNASLADEKLNQKTDGSAILHQASIFNGAGRVFAPRYRQAHYQCFFTKDKASAGAALDLAYSDLKNAFEYYLEHYNQGRPIIIAAHSQGARHGLKLVREFFDGQPLQKQLVAAYLVGWPLPKDAFQSIPPCETPEQTGCACSWRSFRHGHLPQKFGIGEDIIVTNPLTWNTSASPAPKTLNEGTVLKNFNKIYPQIADAEIRDGVLWVHKPRFPGSFFFNTKNYHIADFNLFYVNVRKNAQTRVGFMLKK